MFEPHVLLYNRRTPYERYLVNVNPSLLLSFSTPRSNLLNLFSLQNKNYPVFHADEYTLGRYRAVMVPYFHATQELGQDLYEQALLYQLLALLYADCYDGDHVDTVASRHEATVATLLDYIRENLDGDLSLTVLADIANYSEYHLCKIFKNVTHYTLNQYILEKRISRAMKNLAAGTGPKIAAELSGFGNYSNFYKCFRKYTGMGPQDYIASLVDSSGKPEN